MPPLALAANLALFKWLRIGPAAAGGLDPTSMAVAVIGLLGLVAGAIISVRANRKKTEAEAAQAIQEASMALLKPLQDRIQVLEALVANQVQRIAELEDQVTELGGHP